MHGEKGSCEKAPLCPRPVPPTPAPFTRISSWTHHTCATTTANSCLSCHVVRCDDLPRPLKGSRARSAYRAGKKAGEALALSEKQYDVFQSAPTLTLEAPKRFTVDRGATCREMVLKARRGWRFVCQHFGDVTLDAKEGNYWEPMDDYGGLRALMTFVHEHDSKGRVGVKFMGTPSYDKKGVSKQHEPVTHARYRELLQACFESLAATPTMQLDWDPLPPLQLLLYHLRVKWATCRK